MGIMVTLKENDYSKLVMASLIQDSTAKRFWWKKHNNAFENKNPYSKSIKL